MLRALQVISSISARLLFSTSKGKAAIRPHVREVQPDVGCSYWVRNVRFLASTADSTRHEVEIGLMEDTDEPEEDLAQSEELAEEDEAISSEELTGQAGPRRPRLPTSQKKLNRLLSRHVMHDIPEEELSERFVKGTGPGGQAINKTNSAVHLLHIPTGIRIRAQPSRLRGKNREAARKILRMKLDDLRARGLYPLKDGQSVAEDIDVEPDTDNLGALTDDARVGVDVPEKKLDKKARKEAKKAEESALSAAYSQSELKAAKIRARKANRAKKAKKKKRDKDAAESEGEEE